MTRLSPEQQIAFNEIMDFVSRPPNGMLCLKGYAGTGKTFTLTEWVSEYKKRHKYTQIALTAPTHKAVACLRAATPKSTPVEFMTIHKMLGVKYSIDDDGKELFERRGAPEIGGFKTVIVDEVSMLSDELFEHLKEQSARVKIIFMGDPAQVPPVGKLDCEPFLNPEKHNIKTILLSTIMRQKQGSNIVAASFHVRENLAAKYIDLFQFSGGDLSVVNVAFNDDRLELAEEMKRVFSGEVFRQNPDSVKVVAWRNSTVTAYNNFIRKLYYGRPELNQYEVGDMLITNAPYTAGAEDFGAPPLLQNSTEVEIVSLQDGSVWSESGVIISVYVARVKYFDANVECNVEVDINLLKTESEDIVKSLLNDMAEHCKKQPQHLKKWQWKKFYAFKNLFADVSFSYALTVHKAQGSTYNKTFVDVADMTLNDNTVERNRIIYTALTRAKSHCTVLQRKGNI